MAIELTGVKATFLGDSTSLELAADRSVAAMQDVEGSTERLGTAQERTAAKNKQFGGQMSGMGGIFARHNNALRNTSQQLNQVGQTYLVTGNFMKSFAIQIPDLLLGFGTMGAVIGVAAGVLLGLSQTLFDGKTAAETMKDELDELNDAMKVYKTSVELASTSTEGLATMFGIVTEETRETLRLMVRLAELDALESLNDTAEQIQDTFSGGLFGSILEDEIRQFLGLSATFFGLSQEAENVDAALADMEKGLNDLADAAGPAETAAAIKLITDNMLEAVGGVEELTAEQREFLRLLIKAQQNADLLAKTDIASGVREAAEEAARMALNLGISLKAAQQIVDLAGAGAGRGGAPNQKRVVSRSEIIPPPKPKGDRAGRRAKAEKERLEKQLERVEDSLLSELELEEAHNQRRHEILVEAREAELLTKEQFDERERGLAIEHALELDKIRRNGTSREFDAIVGGGKAILNAVGTNNKKVARLAKQLGAFEALVNAYRAAAQALADPSLPWFAKFAAAAAVLATGIGFANSIRGASDAGGGAGATAATPAAPANAGSAFFTVNLQGEGNIARSSVRGLLEALGDELENGATLRGITVNG